MKPAALHGSRGRYYGRSVHDGIVSLSFQTEIDRGGSEENLETVLYFLRATSLRVEQTFRELSDSKNCDAAARKLATSLLEKSEHFPSDTSPAGWEHRERIWKRSYKW